MTRTSFRLLLVLPSESKRVLHPAGGVELPQPLRSSQLLRAGQIADRTYHGIVGAGQAADDGRAFERLVTDHGKQISGMRSGDYLKPTFCSLPFDQVKKQPQSRWMNPGVDLFEDLMFGYIFQVWSYLERFLLKFRAEIFL